MADLKTLVDRLCPALVSSVDTQWPPCVVTSLYYPDGDSINLYFNHDGDEVVVSDNGATITGLRHGGVDFSAERTQIISAICSRSDVAYANERLSIRSSVDDLAETCLTFCNTLAQVASFHYHQVQRQRSSLPTAVDRLLRERVKASRRYKKEWTYKKADPDKLFPVDYRFAPTDDERPRNLFYVTSDGKASLVTTVTYFLRDHGLEAPTMTILDPKATIHGQQIKRLHRAGEVRYGLKGHEDDIARWALGQDAA